jgi:hypothetical protein
MINFLYAILQRRTIFFYLLFFGYQIFVHPWLLDHLPNIGGNDTDLFLGCFLLVLLFLELWGFWLKHPIMVYYARRHPISDPIPEKSLGWAETSGSAIPIMIVIFVPILHLGMAFFMYAMATQIGGLDPGGSAPVGRQLLYVAGFFVVLLKEAGMIGLFYSPYGIRGPSNDTYPTLGCRGIVDDHYPAEIRLEHLVREAFGDLVLLLFSMVAYSVLWEGLLLVSSVHSFDLYDYLGMGFYFLMAILPLQSVYVFQAISIRQTGRQRIWMVVSFLLIVFVAILTFPQG